MNSQTRTLTEPALVLRRTYAAPRERVFRAWTSPEIAAKFFCPEDIAPGKIEMDVRPGGRYRIEMIRPDGDSWFVGGEYRDVREPERLSMTWVWEEDDKSQEHESMLTLEFFAAGSGTELVLTHERFASEESRDGHSTGWTSIMARLDEALR